MKLTILEVEKQLRSEGVALMKWGKEYEFWNIKDKAKNGHTWVGGALRLTEVLQRYKDYTDDNIHLEGKRRAAIINRLSCGSILLS